MKALPPILLVDRSTHMIEAWKRHFHDIPTIKISQGSPLEIKHARFYVAAMTNSFGDLSEEPTLKTSFGPQFEQAVQQRIAGWHWGELPVGQACLVAVPLHDKFCIVSPTMRLPQYCADSINAYLAFRAVLCVCRDQDISDLVVVPSMCLGIGRMNINTVARQMRAAYDAMTNPPHWPLPIDQVRRLNNPGSR